MISLDGLIRRSADLTFAKCGCIWRDGIGQVMRCSVGDVHRPPCVPDPPINTSPDPRMQYGYITPGRVASGDWYRDLDWDTADL